MLVVHYPYNIQTTSAGEYITNINGEIAARTPPSSVPSVVHCNNPRRIRSPWAPPPKRNASYDQSNPTHFPGPLTPISNTQLIGAVDQVGVHNTVGDLVKPIRNFTANKKKEKKKVTWSKKVHIKEIERSSRHEVLSIDLLLTEIALDLARASRSQEMATAVFELLKSRQEAATSIRVKSANGGWTGDYEGFEEIAMKDALTESFLLEDLDEQARRVVPYSPDERFGWQKGSDDSTNPSKVWHLKDMYRTARQQMRDEEL
ncbi:unnamed protein product [Choristocarpus tenellus]